jgi:hypothetical protein
VDDEDDDLDEAVGHEGNEVKRLLVELHQEPESMPLAEIARKLSSDEMDGSADAEEAEMARMAAVICLETFIVANAARSEAEYQLEGVKNTVLCAPGRCHGWASG